MNERYSANSQQLRYSLMAMERRILVIEERLKINKDVQRATRAQKMLLLQHLGLLDKLQEFKASKQKLAAILSIILDSDADNIRKDLSTIEHPKSQLITENNLEFLHEVFSEAGLTQKVKEIEELMDKNVR